MGPGSLCRFCGRSACRCGEPYPFRKCPHHGATMKVVSIASRSRNSWKWFEFAQCTRCDFARSIKRGQGVPRNENTKTNNPRHGATGIVHKMGQKFGAEIRAVVKYPAAKQEARRVPIRTHAVQRIAEQSYNDACQAARAEHQKRVNAFWAEQDRQKRIKEDEDVPF